MKIADCIALFSLDAHKSVPVDTHVFQLANRLYLKPKIKTLTKGNYDQVAKSFVDVFGDKAGKAHQIMFAGDLVQFKQEVNSKKREMPEEETKEGSMKKRRV